MSALTKSSFENYTNWASETQHLAGSGVTCITGYALSRGIHRIHSDIYFENPDWNKEWLCTVDRWFRYPAYH